MKNATKLIVAALMMASTIAAFAQAAKKPEVNQRLQNQRERINNGAKNGRLTPAQAQALHKDDRAIHREIHNDREQNGGKLTSQEKARVNRQENRVSSKIYDEKHPNAPQR